MELCVGNHMYALKTSHVFCGMRGAGEPPPPPPPPPSKRGIGIGMGRGETHVLARVRGAGSGSALVIERFALGTLRMDGPGVAGSTPACPQKIPKPV